jgi:hypothetical protein
VLAEVLGGISTVKAFVWEEPFARAISAIREKERLSISWAQLLKSFNFACFFFSPSRASSCPPLHALFPR